MFPRPAASWPGGGGIETHGFHRRTRPGTPSVSRSRPGRAAIRGWGPPCDRSRGRGLAVACGDPGPSPRQHRARVPAPALRPVGGGRNRLRGRGDRPCQVPPSPPAARGSTCWRNSPRAPTTRGNPRAAAARALRGWSVAPCGPELRRTPTLIGRCASFARGIFRPRAVPSCCSIPRLPTRPPLRRAAQVRVRPEDSHRCRASAHAGLLVGTGRTACLSCLPKARAGCSGRRPRACPTPTRCWTRPTTAAAPGVRR